MIRYSITSQRDAGEFPSNRLNTLFFSMLLVGVTTLFAVIILSSLWDSVVEYDTPAGDHALLEVQVDCMLQGDCFTGAYSRFGFRHPGPGSLVPLAVIRTLIELSLTGALNDGAALLLATLILNALCISLALLLLRHSGIFPYVLVCVVFLVSYRFERSILLNFWNPYLGSWTMLAFYAAVVGSRFGSRSAALFAGPLAALSVQNHLLSIIPCSLLLGYLLSYRATLRATLLGVVFAGVFFLPHGIEFLQSAQDSWVQTTIEARRAIPEGQRVFVERLEGFVQTWGLPLRFLSADVRHFVLLGLLLFTFLVRPSRFKGPEQEQLRYSVLAILFAALIGALFVGERGVRYLYFFTFPAFVFFYACALFQLSNIAPKKLTVVVLALTTWAAMAAAVSSYRVPQGAALGAQEVMRCFQSGLADHPQPIQLHLRDRVLWREASMVALSLSRGGADWCASGEMAFFFERSLHCKRDELERSLLRLTRSGEDNVGALQWRRAYLGISDAQLKKVVASCLG